MDRLVTSAVILCSLFLAACSSQPLTDDNNTSDGDFGPYVMAYNKLTPDDETEGIALVDTSGQEIEVLAGTDHYALVGPSGNGRLILGIDEPDGVDVYDLATGMVLQHFKIVDTASLDVESTAISPDGTRVAYTVRAITDGSTERTTFLADVDSGNVVKVETGPAYESFARFSPDGETLGFFTHAAEQADIRDSLCLVNAATGDYHSVARVGIAANDWFQWWTWSSDGSAILYPDVVDYTIHRVSVATGESTVVGDGTYPDLSHDGLRMVYLVDVSEPSAHLAIVNTDGSGDTTDLGFAGVNPQWSPDDRKILAFEYDPNGDLEDLMWKPVIYDVATGEKTVVGERGVLGFWVEDVR
jgi:Tol biopolymer transport system component